MLDKYKTKGQLIGELEMLRRRVKELESVEAELENEQRWPEKALHETAKRYQALVETNLYGIQEIDIYGIITYMNAVFYRILGYRTGDLKGKQIWDLLANDSERDRLTDYLTRIAEGDQAPFPWVGEYIRADGETLKLQVDWNHHRDVQGRITGFVSVISSVVDRQPFMERGEEEMEAMEVEAPETAAAEPPEPEETSADLELPPAAAEVTAPEGTGESVNDKLDELGQMIFHLYEKFQTKLRDDQQKNEAIDKLQRALLDRGSGGGGREEGLRAPAGAGEAVSGDGADPEIRRLLGEVQALRREFSEKLKFDAHKNKIIDNLHNDLQEYKSDFARKYMQSIIMDLIQVIDNFRKLADHYDVRDPDASDPDKLLRIIKNIPSDLEDIFYRQGVKPFTCDGEIFDPSRQRVLKTLVTDEMEKDKMVAESLRPGYEWDGQVIRPEIVSAYIYKQEHKNA